MKKPKKDLQVYVGQQFYKLTIIGIEDWHQRTKAFVMCSCGKSSHPRLDDVLRGHTTSCGHCKKQVTNYSKYHGVRWNSKETKWETFYGNKTIAFFYDEKDAAHAYDHYLRSTHKFGNLNFPRTKVRT